MQAECTSTDGDIDDPTSEVNMTGVSSEDKEAKKMPMRPQNAPASERERSKRTEDDNLNSPRGSDPAGETDALRDAHRPSQKPCRCQE